MPVTKKNPNVHGRLLNWAAWLRSNMDPAPKEHPKSASWQGQIKNPGDSVDDVPDVIDDEDAGAVQGAMVLLMCHDIAIANKLIRRYRDKEYIDIDAEVSRFRAEMKLKKKRQDRDVARAKNILWKYL